MFRRIRNFSAPRLRSTTQKQSKNKSISSPKGIKFRKEKKGHYPTWDETKK